MSQTLIFYNPGEIDIRGACIAGLSAKESNSPIGYFGTGLKYSIACILRWGGSITIYSGTDVYNFYAEELDFRGQQFKQVVMRHAAVDAPTVPLGFTTEYGKDWEPWQVFRELYANARDEGGGVRLNQPFDETAGEQGSTTILVSGVPDLVSAYYERDEIILPLNKHWQQETSTLQFNPAPASGLYYRGVRVHEQPCLYTWNFLKDIQLTEDRTLKSIMEASFRFDSFLANDLEDEEIIQRLLEIKLGLSKEPRIEFKKDGQACTSRPSEGLFIDWFCLPSSKHGCSQTFQRVACRMYQRDPVGCQKLRPLVQSIDIDLIRRLEHRLSSREQAMLDKAKELVALFGFEAEINHVPIYVQELGGQTLGLYENGTIYLSPKLFDQGTKQLVATLYEECYHHRTAQQDCTYSMQSDLFNIIISLNEEVHHVIC